LLYGLADVLMNIQVARLTEGKWKSDERRRMEICFKMTHPGGNINGWQWQ
jgi:hypothetical protein